MVDNYLSRAPYKWMHNEMLASGIQLDYRTGKSIYDNIQNQKNGTGIHDSNCWFWFWRDDHPIMSADEVKELEKTDRTIFYYDSPQERLRR